MAARLRIVIALFVALGLGLQAMSVHVHAGDFSPGDIEVSAGGSPASAAVASAHEACWACRSGKERERSTPPPARLHHASVANGLLVLTVRVEAALPNAPAIAAGGPRAPPVSLHSPTV